MREQPTIESILVFSSDTVELDFNQITKMIGQEPQSVRSLTHGTAAGSPARINSSEWILSSGPEILDSVNEGLVKLVNQMAHAETIARISIGLHCDVTLISKVRIYDWDDRPFIKLSPTTIAVLHKVGAAWQLDLTDFSR